MNKNILLTCLLTVLFIQLHAQFDPNARYKISNQWQPAKSLDVINDNRNYDQVWIDNTQNVTGQSWSITPITGQKGSYRLSP